MSDALISCRPTLAKWAHTVAHTDGFQTEWQASEDAFDLARELGFAPEVPVVSSPWTFNSHSYSPPRTDWTLAHGFSRPLSALTSCQPPITRRPTKKVHFDNFIGLRMQHGSHEADFTVAHGLLSTWTEKPWKLRYCSVFDTADSVETTWLMQTSVATHPWQVSGPCDGRDGSLSEETLTWLTGLEPHLPPEPLMISSHGLSETSVGTRCFVLEDPRPEAFLAQLRAKWPEYGDAFLKVHLVMPQPVDLTPQRHFVVEFLTRSVVSALTPTLEETIVWGAFGQSNMQRAAAYHQARIHHADVTSPFSSLCSRAQYVCTVRAQGKELPLDFTRSIQPGALVQLHAYPPRLNEPAELSGSFSGLDSFFTDSQELLGSFQLPPVTWRFHLLQADGYFGSAEAAIPVDCFAAPSAVVSTARSLWNFVPSIAMAYAGLSWIGDFERAVQDFVLFDPDSGGFPCLVRVWIDPAVDIPLPPPTAAFLPDACTLRDIIASSLNALWLLELDELSVEVSDGFLTFDHTDRFRPRHGAHYVVLVKPLSFDESSNLQTSMSRERLDLVSQGGDSSGIADLCPGKPSQLTLLDEWIQQTSLPQALAEDLADPDQDAGEPPLLIIDEWEKLQHLLEVELEGQNGELQLSMHGLLWSDIGCRFASASPDIPSIREAVIRTWEDYLRGQLVGYLHLVIPQERLPSNELQLIIEMRLPFADPPGDGTPILRRITWHYLEGDPQVLAVYQTSGMSLSAFLAQAGLSQLCLAPDSHQCNLHVEKRIQLPLSPVVLRPGTLVEIFLHGPDTDSDSHDGSALMQLPKPTRSPDLIPIRLLGINYVNTLFYANQDEAMMTQLRRNWPLPSGGPVSLEADHFVACPPTTLGPSQEHVYLIQQREDRFLQAHTNDVLILVTISRGSRRPELSGGQDELQGPSCWNFFVLVGSVTNRLLSVGPTSTTTRG